MVDIPKGYVMVPREPTEADVQRVARVMCDRVNGQGDYDEQPWRRSGWNAQARAGIVAFLATAPQAPVSDREGDGAFQAQVQPWLMECFGPAIAGDREERNHRFLEEALELVQACGCTASEAHQLVDYVYGRPIGELHQEIGGVMVTLAALCLANDADMHEAGRAELNRIWGKVEQIRAKQAAKPKHSPLPQVPTTNAPISDVGER